MSRRGRLTPAVAVVAALAMLFAGYLAREAGEAAQLAQVRDAFARADFERAAVQGLDPDRRPARTRAMSLRAYALLRALQPREALPAFAAALRLDPNNWALHRDRAIAFAATGRRAQARASLERALALNPRMPLPPGFAVRR